MILVRYGPCVNTDAFCRMAQWDRNIKSIRARRIPLWKFWHWHQRKLFWEVTVEYGSQPNG